MEPSPVEGTAVGRAATGVVVAVGSGVATPADKAACTPAEVPLGTGRAGGQTAAATKDECEGEGEC